MNSKTAAITRFVAERVQAGFDSIHEIVEDARQYAFEVHGKGDWNAEIHRIVAHELAEHREMQAGWESSTDCDRLDQAFASLNQQGIVARQNFSCCNNCGFVEIWDEVEREEKIRAVSGYVFYHLQCIEYAVRNGQLLLAFGSVEEDENSLRNVVESVVAELKQAGLDTSWEGTTAHPIVVNNIVWQKRRL